MSARKAAFLRDDGRTYGRRQAIRIKFREGEGKEGPPPPSVRGRQSVFYVNGHSRQEGLSLPPLSVSINVLAVLPTVLCCFLVCLPHVMGNAHWQPAQRRRHPYILASFGVARSSLRHLPFPADVDSPDAICCHGSSNFPIAGGNMS